MKKIRTCTDCGRPISKDEIALSKKLIDVDTEAVYCISCMAESFGCTEDDLRAKIQEFKEQGCTLFL